MKSFIPFLTICSCIVLNISYSNSQPSSDSYSNPKSYCGMDQLCAGGSGVCSTLPHFPMSNDTLKALVVFCNFPNPSGNYDVTGSSLLEYWPGTQAQQKPSWADSIICPTTSNVWNRSLTGLFRDASLGKFWLIGDVYPQLYVFQNQVSYYAATSKRIGFAIKELLENIDVNYANYDKFDPCDLDTDGNKREPDGIVDFIFICFRFTNAHTIDDQSYSGIATLGGCAGQFGPGVNEITLDNKRIIAGFPGSGCISELNAPWNIGIPEHEFAEHYSYGRGHSEKMGAYNIGGIASAYDREYLNWTSSGDCSSPSSNGSYTLPDYITTGDYIKITRSNYTLYLENRRRLSYYASTDYRRWKWLSGEPKYPLMPDSGLVIYRSFGDRLFDIQSANGEWNWASCGGGQYKIDFHSHSFNFFSHGSLNRFQGESTFDLDDRQVLNLNCQTIQSQVNGTVTETDYMGIAGDSNTCFDVDYNQVYSPWSNPPLPVPTTSDSLTIEITGRNTNGSLNVDVYFTNILGASPSKPYGLLAVKNYIDQPPSLFHPRLTWNKNLEPDLQKYIIYRGEATSTEGEATSYEYLTETTDTFYTDVSLTLRKSGGGSGPCAYVLATYSYKVSSLDFSSKESVKSERSNISGYTSPCEEEGQGSMPYANANSKNSFGLGTANEISEFKLYDNYPNPFNPFTTIRFDIPEGNNVRITIYSALGEQITTLMNEYRTKGSHVLTFKSENLSSGIYYYKLEFGSYFAIKKMVILK